MQTQCMSFSNVRNNSSAARCFPDSNTPGGVEGKDSRENSVCVIPIGGACIGV